ncbi:MAG: hypothetical protein JXA99_03345 [Candidatus Lokiarchaeota archaeon]|nr:hypothetical protein [Candidatus Lokiarchaeota archaeon]
MSKENVNQFTFLKEGRIIGKGNFELTPEISSKLAVIYGSQFDPNESVIIGRDYHYDCRMLKRAFSSGLMSSGINTLNLSSCTFPLLQFTIRRFGASGGIYFSGGHLYPEDVSIRFVDAQGINISEQENQDIIDSYNNFPKKINRADSNSIGKLTGIPQTEDIYIKSLEQFINKKKIGDKNWKIVIDCAYSPVGQIIPLLLNDIGTEIIALNTHYRQRIGTIPNIKTIRNTAEIVKASESHLGICFDVDASRILIIDENGAEISFEDLLMLFMTYNERIQNSKGNTIIINPEISSVVKNFIEESGFSVKEINNYPGSISRQIREERACFAASDELNFYFPNFAPFSDGNLILLKVLEIMTNQDDLISSLIKGFPKGININKTIPISSNNLENIHQIVRDIAIKHNYRFYDILNDLKIIKEDVAIILKLAISRNAILLSAESTDTKKAKHELSVLAELIQSAIE